MKSNLFSVFALFFSFAIVAQESGFDRFFSQHPFDLQIGTHISSYEFTNLETNAQQEGITGNISGGLGWRYSIVRSDYFSLAPRLGLELGYYTQDEHANLTFHVPLTLDFTIGAGSTKASNALLGVSFGGGYALNAHSYTIVEGPYQYNVSKAYFAPIVYSTINFRIDDTTFGVKPAVSWNKDYVFIGLSFVGYLTFTE